MIFRFSIHLNQNASIVSYVLFSIAIVFIWTIGDEINHLSFLLELIKSVHVVSATMQNVSVLDSILQAIQSQDDSTATTTGKKNAIPQKDVNAPWLPCDKTLRPLPIEALNDEDGIAVGDSVEFVKLLSTEDEIIADGASVGVAEDRFVVGGSEGDGVGGEVSMGDRNGDSVGEAVDTCPGHVAGCVA